MDVVQVVADIFINSVFVPTMIAYQSGWFYANLGINQYIDTVVSRTVKTPKR